MVSRFAFRVTGRDGRARVGELRTPHGLVPTPAFMPVGTRGAVKAVTQRELESIGADILLANTYHLFLRPGSPLVARRGGLHRFMGWHRPMLTDSGGYQIFSLARLRRIDDEGATFRSHLDGRSHRLTPELAVDVQADLGSDITMVLDQCAPYPIARDGAADAMERSLRWARRARARLGELVEASPSGPASRQAQFGIVQGGVHPDLRQASAEGTVAIGFDGYAIGGLSVGEPVDLMYEMVDRTTAWLPHDQPRYLMGTGTPADLLAGVARGIDLFDCVLPTRNARNGQLFTRQGPLVIKNARYAEDDRPVDPDCPCETCRRFSRAYLRHLFVAREMTAGTLLSLHNLYFYLDTLRRIREAIVFGRFESFMQAFLRTYSRPAPSDRLDDPVADEAPTDRTPRGDAGVASSG